MTTTIADSTGARPRRRRLQNPWLQFVPIFLVFGIFYFLLIAPMRKRQKALQQLVESLKKGDRVVTNGGIYGEIASVEGPVVHLKIADNVRVKVAKSAIAGLEAAAEEGEVEMNRSLLWRGVLILACSSPCRCSRCLPPKEKINLGLDLQGGMHLVLQVDDRGRAARRDREGHGAPAPGAGRGRHRHGRPRPHQRHAFEIAGVAGRTATRR